jgi:hypothetical protein
MFEFEKELELTSLAFAVCDDVFDIVVLLLIPHIFLLVWMACGYYLAFGCPNLMAADLATFFNWARRLL